MDPLRKSGKQKGISGESISEKRQNKKGREWRGWDAGIVGDSIYGRIG